MSSRIFSMIFFPAINFNWIALTKSTGRKSHSHYGDVIMTTIASQITSLTVVYSIVYSDADQRKHRGANESSDQNSHQKVLAMHYCDVIMNTIASQITSLTIVYLFRAQIKENIKAPRHWPLCEEFTGTGEFPAQRASYAENVSIWWRHHGFTVNFIMRVKMLFLIRSTRNLSGTMVMTKVYARQL